MPEICRFLGIVIAMFYREHIPPHFTTNIRQIAPKSFRSSHRMASTHQDALKKLGISSKTCCIQQNSTFGVNHVVRYC